MLLAESQNSVPDCANAELSPSQTRSIKCEAECAPALATASDMSNTLKTIVIVDAAPRCSVRLLYRVLRNATTGNAAV